MHAPTVGTDALSRADRHDVASRLAVVDTLKAVASRLIVLHHLVAYGPLAEAFRSRFPRLADWLYYDGRLAVQVFLVSGGFLAARALQPRPLSLPAVL
jgi:peptidoglycan/LPS O-acetylase OafA/YrhL